MGREVRNLEAIMRYSSSMNNNLHSGVIVASNLTVGIAMNV